MDNKDYTNSQDLLNMSNYSVNQGQPLQQNFTQGSNNQYPSNMMFNPLMFQNQGNNFPQDFNKSTQNNFGTKNFNLQGSNQSSFNNNPNMMFNYEMMQNMMRMYSQQANPMAQMFGMNNMVNPMEYFAMANAYNQMFLSNMNNIQSPNFNPPIQNLPDFSKQSQQNGMKFDEIFNKNASELNKFYQYLNTQSRDSDPSKLDLYSTYRTDNGPKSVRTDTENNEEDNKILNQSRQDDFYQDKSLQQNTRGVRRPQTSNLEERSNASSSNHIQSSTFGNNFDERPITAQAQNQNKYYEDEDRPIKPAQTNAFDERPIKPANNNFFQDTSEKGQKSSRSDFDDQPVGRGRDTKKFQKVNRSISEEPDDEPQEATNYHDEFDDLPITGKTKKFEDLLEEQLRADPSAIPSRSGGNNGPKRSVQFLKRGAGHVSSAALKPAKRVGAKKDQKENFGVNEFPPSNSSFPGNRQFASNSNVNNQERPTQGGSKADLFDFNDASKKDSKEPKKFLARGAGSGGGKGSSTQNLRSDSEGVTEEKGPRSTSTRRGADKVPETTYDRIGNTKYDDKKKDFRSDHTEEEDSFDKEYNMDKYAKSSGKKGKKTPESLKTPAYQFDDEYEFEDDNAKPAQKKSNVRDFEQDVRPLTGNKKAAETKAKNEKVAPVVTKPKIEIDMSGTSEDVRQYVTSQLESLETEISKFKLENERVKKEKQQYEDMIKTLQKKIDEWQGERENDLKEFEEWKNEEIKRIKQMKKDSEKQNKASAATSSSKKEREEIEALKKQIAKLNEDIQSKDKKSKNTIDSLKKQIDDLTTKNAELHSELKNFEQLRIKGLLVAPGSTTKQAAPKHVKRNSLSNAKAYKTEEDDYASNRIREADNEEDDDQYKYEDVFNAPNRGTARSTKNLQTEEKKKPDVGRQSNKSPILNKDKEFTLNTLSSITKAESVFQRNTTPKKDADNFKSVGKSNANMSFEKERSATKNPATDDEYKYDGNVYFRKYIMNRKENQPIAQNTSDGKIQKVYSDGRKEVIFHNGVKREMLPDGYTVVYFTNSDIKQTLPDNTIIYYFAEAQTTQTTLPTGRNIYRFANNQVEYHNPDGTKEIFFADGTKKFIKANLEEETVFSDGTIQKINAQKIKTIEYQNGQKDVIYPDGLKVKSYPDGRIKKYYPDGNVEEY